MTFRSEGQKDTTDTLPAVSLKPCEHHLAQPAHLVFILFAIAPQVHLIVPLQGGWPCTARHAGPRAHLNSQRPCAASARTQPVWPASTTRSCISAAGRSHTPIALAALPQNTCAHARLQSRPAHAPRAARSRPPSLTSAVTAIERRSAHLCCRWKEQARVCADARHIGPMDKPHSLDPPYSQEQDWPGTT